MKQPLPTSLQALASQVEHFIENKVIPMEPAWLQEQQCKDRIVSELREESLDNDLWGLFYPKRYGGKIHSLQDYLPVAELEGRSELSQPLFGCQSALDAHILANFAPPEIQKQFLPQMAAAKAIPAYAMTEPDQPGSVPACINTQAQKKQGQWHINGKKWFICNAKQATFITVVARTSSTAPTDKAYSMLLVPADFKGVSVTRSIPVLGKDMGQAELSFDNVRIPLNYLIGEPGQGMALMKYRLGTGRLLRAMHWLGMAQRCFDLMGQRIHCRKSKAADLENKQLVRQMVFTTHQQIASAREILRLASRQLDTKLSGEGKTGASTVDVNTAALSSTLLNSAKVACSNALYSAADAAVQIHGAEGLSDQTPLGNFFLSARATRFMDGANEALISAAGAQLIKHFRSHSRFVFSATD